MNRLSIPKNIRWLFVSGIFFLLLMTVLRAVFLMIFPAPSGALPIPYTQSFILGVRYDARIVSIVCIVIFLLSLFPSLRTFETRRGKKVALYTWFIFIVLLLLFYAVDFANYSYLGERLNGNLLNYVADTRASLAMIWQTYHVVIATIVILILLFLLFGVVKIFYKKIEARTTVKPKNRFTRFIYFIAFFLLLALAIFGRAGQFPLRWSDAFSIGNDYASNVALNPFQSFFSSLKFRNATYDIAAVKKYFPLMAEYLDLPNAGNNKINFERIIVPKEKTKNTPNVVIVICESFSAYKSSMYGNPLSTTPFFASLCKNGVFFNRCFTPSWGTARGVWATVTGIPDVSLTKTSSRNPNMVSQHTIINDFEGYERYYFIGGSASWANIRGVLENNIHHVHLYEQDDYEATKVDVWGVSDKNLFLAANKNLAREKKPFIAVIQTADNHRPYTIPEEDKKEFEILDVPADTLRKYGFESLDEYNAFRYTDFCYKKFMEAVKKESYFSNTVFVFIGDHGIRGDAHDMFPYAWTKELTCQHVPLLFYAPSMLNPKELDYAVSQIDILPTIAGICNIPYTNTTLGRNVLDTNFQKDDAHHVAFIYDPDYKQIGIVKDSVYFSRRIEEPTGEFVLSTKDNKKIKLSPQTRNSYNNLTEAFYETARYMLLNNKIK